MRKLVLSILATGLISGTGWSQTLFTYGNNPVTKQEFLRNYQKNTLNKKPDFSEAALKEYLNLYSLFRMKVREAETMHLDTLSSIQRELENYKKQLSKNYLQDEEANAKLYKEAYERMKEDRHVAHITIMAPAAMAPQDTLRIYQRMDSIYNALTAKKADFAEMAKLYSEDKGTRDRGGDIGFMTALQTIYPFENAVYSTEPGKVSRPFRTQLGYHIIKVIEKRPARGEAQVAHILVYTPKSRGEEGITAARKRIDSIKAAIKAGTPFEDLVKQYSEDRHTRNDGGVMKITVGKVAPVFENAVFALKNPGDISEPVQTDYGFHIIKLIDKQPLKPYDSILTTLKRAIENDGRSQAAKEIYFSKVKAQNGFKEFNANYDELFARIKALPDTGKDANMFKAADFANMNKPLFTMGKNTYTQADLMNFAENVTRGRLMGNRQQVTKELYNMFVGRVVADFQEAKLLQENEDFRNLMTEYRDGIMLFELMDQNVWGKASRDSVGLKAFYEANKSKYMWEPGFQGTVYRFKDEASMKKGLAALNKKSATEEDVVKAVNDENNPNGVTVQQGRYEFSRFKDVPQEKIVKGKTSAAVQAADGSYIVVRAKEVYNSPSQKSLDDARGYVVAEYQDHLEKQWNEMLRKKYPVNVETSVFNAMVK